MRRGKPAPSAHHAPERRSLRPEHLTVGHGRRYRRAMRSPWICGWLAALAAAPLTACSEPQSVPPKRPNTELIVGEYERHPPDGETAVRFRGDGSVRIAK